MAFIDIRDREGELLWVVIVDDCCKSLDFHWCATSNGYVVGYPYGNGEKAYLHKYIAGADKDQMVDHINGDKNDNRRCNLRFVTKTQNNWNSAVSKRSSTGVKGVSYNSKNKNYRAKIYFKGKRYEIGSFSTLDEAAKARADVAIKLQGEYAYERRA